MRVTREEADPKLDKLGVRKCPPALSIVCEKHPISKTLGYNTFGRIDTSLVEALSCMYASTRSTEIPYFTERLFLPFIDLVSSWRHPRCCSIFHSITNLITMANALPNHVIPSKIMETFLPSLSALIHLVSSAAQRELDRTCHASPQVCKHAAQAAFGNDAAYLGVHPP